MLNSRHSCNFRFLFHYLLVNNCSFTESMFCHLRLNSNTFIYIVRPVQNKYLLVKYFIASPKL